MTRYEQPSEPGPRPLLRPVTLGDLRLPNRVLMAPLTRCRATNPGLEPDGLHAAYYGQRAGAGLIVAEATWVSERAGTGAPITRVAHADTSTTRSGRDRRACPSGP